MEALRGFGITGVLAALLILVSGSYEIRGLPILPIGALLALAWVQLSYTPWSELGFVRPRHLILTIATALIFGAAFKLVLKALVMPFWN